MEIRNILWRNMKWRYQTPISIMLTIIQPLIWLVLYGAIAEQSMQTIVGTQNYIAFMLPGIMVLVTLACCSSGGYLNFIMKSKGSFYRILISPVSRKAIVIGQILEAVLLSLLETGVLLLVGALFRVRISTGILGFVLVSLIIFVTAFFMSSVAYTISLCLPHEVIYETIINLIVLSIFFASTALFPLKYISGWLKTLVFINPFSHAINSIRALILGTHIDWNNIIFVIVLFVGLSILGVSIAVVKLQKEMVG